MAGKLHVVTGTPGTAVKKALQSLQRYANRIGHRTLVDPISVDEILRRLADDDVKKLGLPPSSLLAVFRLPQSRLRELWSSALKRAFDEVDEQLAQDNDVILTLHLCYFHHKYREFIVAANFDLFKRLAKRRVQRVVTLIDDIYDIYARLTGPGQTFNPPEDVETAYIDSLRTLTWRANELMISDSLSAALVARHFVFATKHPVEALHRLLYSNRPSLYISHPITEVRRLRKDGKDVEAQKLVDEIAALVRDLSEDYVVFEPTAIDELRFIDFNRNQPPKSGNLSPRWPFREDKRETCWTKPSVPAATNRFPIGWDDDARDKIDGGRPAIREFIESIEKQISARDHWLVEQSDFLVCLRPVFDGHASSGVRAELEHVKTLRVLQVKTRPAHAFVVSPDADNSAFPARELADEILPSFFAHGQITGAQVDFRKLQLHLRAMQQPDQTLKSILSSDVVALQTLLGQFLLRLDPLADRGVMGDSREARRDDRAQEIATEISDTAQLYLIKLQSLLTIFPDTKSMLAGVRSAYPPERRLEHEQA